MLALVTSLSKCINILEENGSIKVDLKNLRHSFVGTSMPTVGEGMTMSYNTLKLLFCDTPPKNYVGPYLKSRGSSQ